MGLLKFKWEADQSAQPDHIKDLPGGVIEFKLVKGQRRKGVYRSERRAKIPDPLNLKMSFKFRVTSPVNFDNDLVIAQLPWDGGSPDNSIRIKDGTAYYLNYNQGGRTKRDEKPLVPGFKPDVWHEVAYLLTGRSDNSGRVQIWVDGNKTVDRIGQNIWPPTDKDAYPKIGPYAGDDEIPHDIVIQYKDIKFGDRNATFEELSDAGSEPENQRVPETPKEPDPKEKVDISEELYRLSNELQAQSDSNKRQLEILKAIQRKLS